MTEAVADVSLDWLKRHLRTEEGYRTRAYLDTEGHPTIGIGHRITGLPVEEALRLEWTGAQIEEAFESDVAECIHDAASFGWWHVLSPLRQAVVCAMCFQLGRAGVAGFTRMAAAIRASRFHEAAREMLDSRWHRQTPRRCERLARIMRDGRRDD